MINEIWLNFPVKDVNKTKDFYSKIGFAVNEKHTNANMVSFIVGKKNTAVLFFDEKTFSGFAQNNIADPANGSEILVSFDAENREDVDETARKVFEAGGKIFAEPADVQGWMYGFGFADPDGHRWNMVFMDFSKMPQS